MLLHSIPLARSMLPCGCVAHGMARGARRFGPPEHHYAALSAIHAHAHTRSTRARARPPTFVLPREPDPVPSLSEPWRDSAWPMDKRRVRLKDPLKLAKGVRVVERPACGGGWAWQWW